MSYICFDSQLASIGVVALFGLIGSEKVSSESFIPFSRLRES